MRGQGGAMCIITPQSLVHLEAEMCEPGPGIRLNANGAIARGAVATSA